ncbi:MAG: DUF6089 family protein [Agriterribacter sp.]
MKQILIVAFIALSINSYSQGFIKKAVESFSLEAFGGLANYQGELQEAGYTFSQAKPAVALGGRIELANRFFLRGLVTYGHISAADKYSNSSAKRLRNLDFTSKIYDASVTFVYEVFDVYEKRYTPYVFAGVSAFHFSPYTFDSSGKQRWLQPYGTEGQGLPLYPGRKIYSLNQFSIPFGAGIKFAVTDRISLGWEFRFNKTFTDYLDDVSSTYADYNALVAGKYGLKAAELAYRGGEVKGGNPNYPAAGTQRGNPKTKDWYYFSGITVTYNLFKQEHNFGSGGSSRELSCPKNVY